MPIGRGRLPLILSTPPDRTACRARAPYDLPGPAGFHTAGNAVIFELQEGTVDLPTQGEGLAFVPRPVTNLVRSRTGAVRKEPVPFAVE